VTIMESKTRVSIGNNHGIECGYINLLHPMDPKMGF
jgi:hypothetical protein